MRRMFIQDSIATQCLAIFCLIHQLVLKVKNDVLVVNWCVETEWNHSQSFHVTAKLVSDNIFSLLLLWPRSKWTTEAHHIFIPDPTKNSNFNINKIQVHLPAESYRMSSPPLYFLCEFATAFHNITSVTEEDIVSSTARPSPRPLGGKSGVQLN